MTSKTGRQYPASPLKGSIRTLFFIFNSLDKVGFYLLFRYLLYMKQLKKEEEKKVKISITLNPILNTRMEKELTNKSRLIEKLLTEHYGKKDM